MIFLNLLIQSSFANESAHAAVEHGIPYKLILVQAGNFLVLIGLLVYFLKDKTRAYFKQRASSYRELVGRAEAARSEAQAQKNEIEARLKRLENGAQQSQNDAQQEAEQLKQKLMSEAKLFSERLTQEAQFAAELEIDKAKKQLRRELLNVAVEAATSKLKNEVEEKDRQRLQNEFSGKIQVVP